MHCVIKLKATSITMSQQFEIIKNINRVQITFISEQHNERNNYEQY
jgi:hypothetical protein